MVVITIRPIVFAFFKKRYIKKISGSTDSDLQVESAAEAAETKTLHLNYNITKVDCFHSWPTKSIQQNFHLRNQVAPQWFNSLSCWENFPHCLLRLSQNFIHSKFWEFYNILIAVQHEKRRNASAGGHKRDHQEQGFGFGLYPEIRFFLNNAQ